MNSRERARFGDGTKSRYGYEGCNVLTEELSGHTKRLTQLLRRLLLLSFLGFGGANAHSPHDIIDVLALSPTYSEDRTVIIATEHHLLKSTDGGVSWQELANGLDNRYYFSSAAISPVFRDDGILYVSSYGDGVYKSQNEGMSWTKVNAGLQNQSINSLSIYPGFSKKPILLAAGTDGGLYRTVNGGTEWEEVVTSSTKLTAVAYSSGSKSDRAIAGDSNGNVYVSDDLGNSWSTSGSLSNEAITAIAFAPAPASGVVFAGDEQGSIFRSSDSGANFEKIVSGLGEQGSAVMSLALSPNYASDATVVASTWNDAVFFSLDGGETWKKHSTGLTTDKQADSDKYYSAQFRGIKFSDGFAEDKVLFLAGFDGLFKSIVAGRTWVQMETLPVGLIKGMSVAALEGNQIEVGLATYGGGGYFTNDQGRSWRIANMGVATTRYSTMVFSPDYGTDHTVFSGAKGHLLRSTDSGSTWNSFDYSEEQNTKNFIRKVLRNAGSEDMAETVIRKHELQAPYPTAIAIAPDFKNEKVLFVATRWHGIYRSMDGGATAEQIWDAEDETVADVQVSPNFSFDRTVFASVRNRGVYRSRDGGDTWEPANEGLGFVKEWETEAEDRKRVANDVLLGISPSYQQDEMLFVGSSEGLYQSVDRGNTWNPVPSAALGENPQVIGLSLSPNFKNDQTIVVSVKGKGLFESGNAGQTFGSIDGPLIEDNHAVEFISFSPYYGLDTTIFAATDWELFVSTDGSNSWKQVSRPVRYEDMREPIRYDGEWNTEKSSSYSAQSVHHSDVAGNKAELSFVGSGVTWIGNLSPTHGLAGVSVDGKSQTRVDLYNPTKKNLEKVFSLRGLSSGSHKVTIKVLGKKNPRSAGHRVSIDALDIIP